MSAGIRDVAQRAGVSISTASRALNNRPDVNKNVRARIRAAAQELNYAVNVHARVLGGGRSRTLGLIISNSADPFFAALAARMPAAPLVTSFFTISARLSSCLSRGMVASSVATAGATTPAATASFTVSE